MLGRMVSSHLRDSRDVQLVATSRREEAQPFFDAEDGHRSLRSLISQLGRFDYMLNCIGVLRSSIARENPASVERAVRVNSLFPHVLASVAEDTGARVLHVSTDAVFREEAGQCYEDTPADGTDAYAKSKYLGEVQSPSVLNLRCSIIGPDPVNGRGLLAWFLARRPGESVTGFVDHLWNGVTTLQFAQLARQIIEADGGFDSIRREGPVHHLCPNRSVTKYELLNTFRSVFGVEVRLEPATSSYGPVTRVLDTRYRQLGLVSEEGVSVMQAIEQLAAEMGWLKRQ